MSLLNETASTVIAGKYLKVDQAFNTQFQNTRNLKGYGVITGALLPREVGTNVLVLDNVTEEPVQLPPNVMPYKAFFVPTIPLESTDLTDSAIRLKLWDSPTFNISQDNWGVNGVFTGEQVNSKGYTEMADTTGSVSDFTGYTYPGVEVVNTDFTAGQLQVYIYYIPCQTPILP